MELSLSKVKGLKDANDEQNNQARIKNKRLKMSLKIKTENKVGEFSILCTCFKNFINMHVNLNRFLIYLMTLFLKQDLNILQMGFT